MKLIDFIELAMDDYYKINIFYTNTGEELIHQKEVGKIIDYMYENNLNDILYHDIASWDICEENNNEFCVNVD